MADRVPFFKLFPQLALERELMYLLRDAEVSDVEVLQAEAALRMKLYTAEALTPRQKERLGGVLAAAFSLRRVEIESIGRAPAVTAPPPEKSAGGAEKGTVLMGKAIRGKPVSIKGLNPKMGQAVVRGKVFFQEFYETRRSGVFCLSFHLTDYESSVNVRRYLQGADARRMEGKIREGMWLTVQGFVELTRDGKDIQLSPVNIAEAPAPRRLDTAEEKRVELHLHTSFSNMDALSDPKDLVKQAIAWGHKAVAITDHGVCHAFPNAAAAAGDKIKVLYGVEGYFANDLDDRIAVHGGGDCGFDDEIVCFDLETTGLDAKRDAITEIGAVVLRAGKVTESFQTFADPERPLDPRIVGLTGITEEMLRGAPRQEEALRAFLDFVRGRPLAAHNAEFDVGFLREGCRRAGLPFAPTYIDSLVLAQNLLPELGKYKLDVVAGALNLPEFHHHRATDDAATVAYMLVPFWEKLRARGLSRLSEVNPLMEQLRPASRVPNRQPKHIILLAKNKQGLKNLYQLVSLSNLRYFKRYPWIHKSELLRHRAGLLIGSACEAGELFQAILAHKDWDELKRIASFYDFLEIQPLCNNAFLLRDGRVRSEEELRELNRTVLRLGEELGKPVCATGDVHFKDPEDEVYRRILLDVKDFKDCDEPLPLYFKTTDEMLREFSYLGAEKAYEVVVTNPGRIADQIENIELLPKGRLFPPRLENSEEELNRLVWDKARALYGDPLPELVQKRLEVELKSILGKYDVVYMSAQKLVQRSLENGYLVGSRGSVGSSLVAYMAGITEVNSLPPHYRCPACRHAEFVTDGSYGCGADMPDRTCPVCGAQYAKDGFDIPFETFLGYGGGKVPDIDLNFSGEYQARAHQHAIEMFGKDQVFRAGTIGTVAEKTAFGYVLKYLEKRGLEVPQAEKLRLAGGCVGVKRTTGQHPGGLVVVPDDMDMEDFCPVQHPADAADSDIITTHFEYHAMEDNLLKLDMLGHDDPSMIRMLEDLTGVNARTIPLDDPDTMSIFTSSRVLGYENDEVLGPTGAVAIPEFNTRFTRQMLVDTQPRDFNTLLRLSGFSHGTDVWLGNAKELILSGTAGVLETVGCRDDIMLYLMSKGVEPKMSFQIMEAVRKGKVKKGGFQAGWEEAMRAHGVPEWYIESLAKIGYLFPKAHAVAYVMMAFRIAWFKVHRPLAFYAAYFSIRAKAFDAEVCTAGPEEVKRKIREIENNKDATAVEQDLLVTLEVCYEFGLRGFRFLPLHLYESDATRFRVEGDGLRPPFVAVRGLGEAAAQEIAEKRRGREFASIEEFALSCGKVSRTHIEQLKALGAFAGLPDSSQLSLF